MGQDNKEEGNRLLENTEVVDKKVEVVDSKVCNKV